MNPQTRRTPRYTRTPIKGGKVEKREAIDSTRPEHEGKKWSTAITWIKDSGIRPSYTFIIEVSLLVQKDFVSQLVALQTGSKF